MPLRRRKNVKDQFHQLIFGALCLLKIRCYTQTVIKIIYLLTLALKQF